MKYDFDHITNRKNTNSVKYDAKESILPMWVADMDYFIAPKIKQAMHKDLDIGSVGYVCIPDEFFSAFTNFYARRYNCNFTNEQLVYVSGVVASIDEIIKTIAKENDNVVMLSPIYHTFYHCIENNKCHVLTSQLVHKDDQWLIDYDDLEEKLARKNTSIFILCNPHNPVGKVFDVEELKAICALAKKHNVLVISDEIHGLLTNPGIKYIPYVNVSDNDYFITCMATSKAFNLAGLQSAVILCLNEELRNKLQEVFYKDDLGEPNYFAVNANIAALRDSEDWLDQVNEYIYANKVYFVNYIKENLPELKVSVNEATYMLWVDISSLSMDSRKWCEELNNKVGLLVSPGAQFGLGGEGFFRINLATSLANVKDACERLSRFIKG